MKHHIHKSLVSLLFAFFTFNFAIAQHIIPTSRFAKVNQLKNLPQNDAQCLFKDSKGFMWIGTLDGLHRYDGYSYKTYRINESGNNISSNMIIAIDEDSFGNIWIGTYGKGICKLNPVTEQFTSYANHEDSVQNKISNDVTTMIVDHNNSIWIGNWFGLTKIEFDKEMSVVKNVQPVFSQPTEIKSIFEDKDNQIWAGGNTDLYRIINQHEAPNNIQTEHFQVSASTICDFENGILAGGLNLTSLVKNPNSNGSHYQSNLISTNTSNILIYSNNTIWSGNRDGVGCYEQNAKGSWEITKTFTHNFTEQSIGSNIVTALTTDDLGQIWIGTRGGGVNTINLNPKRFEHFRHTQNPGSLSNDLTRCIYIDSANNLWIGTEEGGVNLLRNAKSNNYNDGFQHLTVNSNHRENRVYAIKELITPHSKKHKSIMFMGTSFPTNLATLDPVTLEVRPTSMGENNVGFVFTIEVENDSTLWAGTYGKGMWKFIVDDDGNIIRNYHFTPNNPNGTSISSFIVRSIFKDSKGNLWVGTDKGLNLITASELKKPNPTIQIFTKGNEPQNLQHDYILQIYEAKNGKIWLGTMGGGLIGVEKENNSNNYTFTSITVADGLPNNSIKSILEDNDGLLWLASNNGLTRYNPFNGDRVNFDVNDGLQDNEFSEICAFKRDNGQFIFGGINGFNVFYPNEIIKDNTPPKMFFTDFLILNKEVKTGEEIKGRVILENSIEYTKSIKLKNAENSFSIGFVGLQYNSPQKNSYKYKLEGFDKQWFSATSDYRIAKYTNISAGDYTFKVIGANCDNVWSEDPIMVNIKIAPPIYLSAWAIVIYMILFLAVAYFLYRIFNIISTRKKELLISNLEKKRLEDITQMKLRFFTNISHEFRTPLTLINVPLDKLMKQDEKFNPGERQNHYQLIKQNVNVMLRLINQLLDFRRLDQDKMKLKIDSNNLTEFVKVVYDSFQPLAQQKEIDFTFQPYFSELDVWFDADKIEKVLYNLLSNAFKFTPRNGKIELKIDEDIQQKRAIISVKDTGIGIATEAQTHIFERYYQPDNKYNLNYGGTGIGLSLSKGLIELHHGEIIFSSEKDKGSKFYVYLPIGKEHFSNETVIAELTNYLPVTPVAPNFEHEETATRKKSSIVLKRQPTILLVEDNIELRKAVADIFQDDFNILEADDGLIGYEMCVKHQPDLVISDIMMPNMSGIQLCEKIKMEEEISHIPIILLTAKSSDEARIEGFETGADNYISKPFNSEVLRASAISIINNKERLRLRFQKEIEINPAIIANSPADSKFLDNILAIIEENLSEADFTVEKLSSIYGVSRIYLNRKLKALTGETSNEFLRNIRLKHAAELLKQNKLTISEVTWQVGYNDLRTFRVRFKEMFGVSPSDFAKNAKGE